MFGEVGSLWLTGFSSSTTPRQHDWDGAGVSTRRNRWIQNFVFGISYCSLIEASSIRRNKNIVSLLGLAAVGWNWVILQITPAGTLAIFISLGDNKNNRGRSRVEIIPVLSNNPITPQTQRDTWMGLIWIMSVNTLFGLLNGTPYCTLHRFLFK